MIRCRYFILLYFLIGYEAKRIIDKDEIESLREATREMLRHAYQNYEENAFPKDELMPISCKGKDTWGGYKLTMIDSIDTLLLTGDLIQFRKLEKIIQKISFDIDKNVSVFETNIRIIGGLLSAHLLYKKAGMPLPTGWPCKGPLLDLAVDVAERILPAFNTTTGMPYGSVNLRYGVAKGETPITCTAGVGTFIIEFGTISRLTGDEKFEKAAMRALEALYDSRSEIGLVGNHINTQTGHWTATEAGIGAGVDSYFEYLVKGYVLFNNKRLLKMWRNLETPIEKFLNSNGWYVWANMKTGSTTQTIAQSLDCFIPGMKTLLGETEAAMQTHLNYYSVFSKFNGWPEFYSINQNLPVQGREGFPLRPEFIESTVYLYQATRDPILLEMGAEFLVAINNTARTDCGFATVDNVLNGVRADRMESFYIAETLKYLYILFEPDHWLFKSDPTGELIEVEGKGLCILEQGGWIFNTEAHPIDPSALECCSKMVDPSEINKMIQDIDFNDLYDDNYFSLSSKQDSNKVDVTCPKEPFYLKLSAWGDVFV